jgi:uncharacterized protein DUF5753
MRQQLLRLRDVAETPRHRVQILRGKSDLYGATTPWGMLSFSEGADVVHVDGFPRGYVLADPTDVATALDAYDLIKASAQPPDESAQLIDSFLKDYDA